MAHRSIHSLILRPFGAVVPVAGIFSLLLVTPDTAAGAARPAGVAGSAEMAAAAESRSIGPASRNDTSQITVGYLTLTPVPTAEDGAAIRWLSSNPKFRYGALDLESAGQGNAGGLVGALDGIDVLWIHIPDSADYQRWKPGIKGLAPLKGWYDSGGRFLFTGMAAMIPHAVGIESAAPAIEEEDVADDWLFDQKGFQGHRPDISSTEGGHPVFDGLFGGAFTWDAGSNHRLWCAGYFGDAWPVEGKVVGVGKSYITISAERKLLLEYRNGRGRGIAAGGYLFLAPPNHRDGNLHRFVQNALAYAAGEADPPAADYWHRTGPGPVRIDFPRSVAESLRAFLPVPRAGGGQAKPERRTSGPVIRRDSATGNFYDVAGRRALVMGKERGGIDEAWIHPFRLLRDYRAGIVSGDTVLWLEIVPAKIEITPDAFTRSYETPFGPITERVFAAPSSPAAVVRYDFGGGEPVRLVVAFRSDLRLMWPYDAPVTGGLQYAEDASTGTLLVSDGPGEIHGFFGADVVPTASLAGRYDSVWWRGGSFGGRETEANQVCHAASYAVSGGGGLTFAMAGGSYGPEAAWSAPEASSSMNDLVREYRIAVTDPAALHESVRAACDSLLRSSTTIESPDAEFNDLYRWAVIGTDRFVANTPGVGEGLLAGYSTTARGWDGGQKISGRPGYAWYFGRDAAWSGFAIDDYGDFGTVRSELELMQRYQDLSGKIFHEISTSGSVHYDASDATPLYVLLAAHYLRASGDTAFIRSSWPNIRRAMDYLYSTDTDGDGLIENANQGHGWVEGGALYPVHTEFYLAGAWGKALLDASFIAATLGLDDISTRYGADGREVRTILNDEFWNPETKFFNLGKKADGTYNTEPTVLPATVMYYGLLDDSKVEPALEQYAGPGFTTDWGVRIVSSASPLFNPGGYHYGSVWPLFTGWTALAEYEYGHSTQGFTHILSNLYIKNHWALGFVEEVMNGAVYKPSGVCPHQCWSETNILHPAITGMVGWKPDATMRRAGLYPRFPIHWDSVKVSNLRAGSMTLDVSMERRPTATTWSLSEKWAGGRDGARSAGGKGESWSLSFAPEIPEGMIISRITLDGEDLPVPQGRKRGLLDPPLTIDFGGGEPGPPGAVGHRLVIEHTGGAGVVPAMPRPEPGDSSTGHRIVFDEMRDGAYEVRVEGRAASTAEIVLRTFDRGIDRLENASIVGMEGEGRYRVKVEFPPAATPYVAITVRARTR